MGRQWGFGSLVGWLVRKKQYWGLYFFPVLEQKSLTFEVLYGPSSQLSVVMRLTSGQMFLSDFARKIADDKLAQPVLWAVF